MKEKCLKTLASEYRERRCDVVMAYFSRSWRRKLEKPVCRRWRGWTAVQQVGLMKPTGVSAGMACQWHGWSMTTEILVHCRSKLGRWLRRSWTGCAPWHKIIGSWRARLWCARGAVSDREPCCRVLYRLKTPNQVGRHPSQQTVAVVKSAED